MKILVEGLDYTAALDGVRAMEMERTLNEPSVCQLWLSLPANGTLAAPTRFQSLSITGDNGTVYFTGYIAAAPMPEYAGLATEGPRYRIAIRAVSDEILLDLAIMAPSKGLSGMTAGTLMQALVAHTGEAALSTAALTLSAPVGNFVPPAGATFSKSAGLVAAQARAAYRALSGALSITTVPGTVHALNETGGSLTLANLSLTASVKRGLANDITVCGEHEPAAYVTEYFLGDGTTTSFYLAEDPFIPAGSKNNLIAEVFNEAAINTAVWANPGGAGYFSLGAAGLVMNGGNGVDGDTQLSWIDPVEMGGTLLLEAQGLTLAAASTGILAGFFANGQAASNCVAGFQATAVEGTGAVSIQPLIEGGATGTSYSINPANQYNLRVRMHCAENERTLATYISCGDSGVVTIGGAENNAAAKWLFELQEIVDGVAGMSVMLYDGSMTTLPATCTVVAASSLNLHGTLRALNLTNLGSGWVVCTPTDDTAYTRRVGSAAQSAECHVERTGKLVFYTGFAPPVGEQIAVNYRTIGRAVGRAVNAASQLALTAAGSPAIGSWIGTVTNPEARSSADCRNAAAAMVQASAGVSALWSGAYRGTSLDFATDVWPGDALALNAPSCSLNAQMVVRSVKLSYRASLPDLVSYEIAFANDWANDLAIKTSATVAADAWLPAAIAPIYLANLSTMTVTSMSGNTVTVNTGATAPTGGGFEVRTRDYVFMAGEDPSLVLRGSAPNLTFSRVSASDRFYMRTYDGSTPPNYSEFSAALFINLPLSS